MCRELRTHHLGELAYVSVDTDTFREHGSSLASLRSRDTYQDLGQCLIGSFAWPLCRRLLLALGGDACGPASRQFFGSRTDLMVAASDAFLTFP